MVKSINYRVKKLNYSITHKNHGHAHPFKCILCLSGVNAEY